LTAVGVQGRPEDKYPCNEPGKQAILSYFPLKSRSEKDYSIPLIMRFGLDRYFKGVV